MRRMYSQAELSAIIKEVFLADVASGQIDLPDLIEQALPEVDFSDIDLVAKTLKQVQANYSLELNAENLSLSTSLSGLTLTIGYCKIEELNNVLYVVLNFSLTNTTESSIAMGNYVRLAIRNLDESISEKIYDANNLPLSEAYASIVGITGCHVFHDNSNPTTGFSGANNCSVQREPNTAKGFNINIREAGSISAGDTRHYTGRFFLTLI